MVKNTCFQPLYAHIKKQGLGGRALKTFAYNKLSMSDPAKTPWLDLLFGIMWAGTLVGTFELFYDLSLLVPDLHPLWSGVFGAPVLHHLYFIELSLLFVWVLSRWWWQLVWTIAKYRA